MRVQMRTEISRLHSQLATTMIYVTHDQVEAMTMGDRICLMKDGRIQQVAEPLEIYNAARQHVRRRLHREPADEFLRDQDIGLLLQVDGAHESKVAAMLNRPIVLGLRPEELEAHDHSPDAAPACVFKARLEVAEPLGAETYLYLKFGPHNFIVRSQNQGRDSIGRDVVISANMSKAHFFESVDPTPFRGPGGEIDIEKWQAACRLIV
jgi:multiple sugar transport system ATP-binding protein